MKKHLYLLALLSGMTAPLLLAGCEVDVDPADEGPIEDAAEELTDDG